MNKFLSTISLLLMLTVSYCPAMAMTSSDASKIENNNNVIIQSDTRHFNPLTGVYDLNGHVYVKFPIHGENIQIKADSAKVKLYTQEVNAHGNITLQFGKLVFKCDQTYVPIKERLANVDGNIYFKHDYTEIKADSAVYNWKTKIATFKNARHNGSNKKSSLTYDIAKKQLL